MKRDYPAAPTRAIRLPNGKLCGAGTYARAWRKLRWAGRGAGAIDFEDLIPGFFDFPTPAHEVLAEMRRGLHDRINQHLPWWQKGRKWRFEWQIETSRAARDLNTPYLALSWLPPHLKDRFEHRLSERD